MRDRDTEIHSPAAVTQTRKDGRTQTDVVDPRTAVIIQEQGAAITLFFEPELAWTGEAALLEIRISPPAGGKFEPWRLMPQLPNYLQYAQATLAHKHDDITAAIRALRKVNSPRRGLTDDFLRFVADDYNAMVAAGEPYPIKTLANAQPVAVSTASRWVSAARARGFLPTEEKER